MKKIKKSSEDEMILEFLKGEYNSIRFNENLCDVLRNLNYDSSIIIDGDINNKEENLKRLKIMMAYRGYPNKEMFNNFPKIDEWTFEELSSEDINKVYNIQMDKLNGIYGMQFAISDFKPETKTVTSTTVLGTNIISQGEDNNGPSNDMSLHDTIVKYFGNQLGSINLSGAENKDSSKKSSRIKAGIIDPFKADKVPIKSTQTATTKGEAQTVEYNNQTGALIYLDTCGIIHENDTEYNEYKKFALPHVKGIVMKKVFGTYVINCTMNGSFDVDLGKSFVLNMPQPSGVTKQLSAFVNGVVWMVTNYKHVWDSESMEVKTFVTGITPFLKRGENAVTSV